MYLQSTSGFCVPDDSWLRKLRWLEDVITHARTTEFLLARLQRFLSSCVQYNFTLHPGRCKLFKQSVYWYGRIISEDGVRFQPRQIDGICPMKYPKSGADLQQFVCAMQWMRFSIPELSSLIRPLADCLEEVYSPAGRRTRLASSKVLLTNGFWNQKHEDAFELCKAVLTNQVTLALENVSQRLSMYTDASDILWSGMVTQLLKQDHSLPHSE